MDLSNRYPIVVQVITWQGREYYRGTSPEFEWVITEPVDPGNVSQEFMFYLGLRRKIAASLTACASEGKSPPLLVPPNEVGQENSDLHKDMRSNDTISSHAAAQLLGIHVNTVRAHFDSGRLKGVISSGGHRMIAVSSVQAELERMKIRGQNRVFEERAKTANLKRKLKRQEKKKAESLARFNEHFSNRARS